MKFAATRCPSGCPWGNPLDEPIQIRPGIWRFQADLQCGLFLSLQRVFAINQKFQQFAPENPFWWGEDADMAVVVASFPEAFSDRTCYVAYHTILSNAQWEERFRHVAELCEGAEIHQRSKKYAADNERFYVRYKILKSYRDKLKLILVRKCDSHAVVVLADRQWVYESRLYSEAEVSMYLVAPNW